MGLLVRAVRAVGPAEAVPAGATAPDQEDRVVDTAVVQVGVPVADPAVRAEVLVVVAGRVSVAVAPISVGPAVAAAISKSSSRPS